MKVVTLKPEWLLRKFISDIIFESSEGVIVLFANISDDDWVKLALETLEIDFEEREGYDNGKEFTIFEFVPTDEFKKECPELYEEAVERTV